MLNSKQESGHHVKPRALCLGLFFFWPLRGPRSGAVPLYPLIYGIDDILVHALTNGRSRFLYIILLAFWHPNLINVIVFFHIFAYSSLLCF